MGGIVTDSTIESGNSEVITGYRSSPGSVGSPVTNTCDKLVTLDDPFDFDVDWRMKDVYNKRKEILPSGRVRRYKVRVSTWYPYITFVRKTRTVKQWRLLISTGESLFQKLPKDLPIDRIKRKFEHAKKRLRTYGKCMDTQKRPAWKQNNLDHIKHSMDNPPPPNGSIGPDEAGAARINLASNDQYGYRAVELPVSYTGFQQNYLGSPISDFVRDKLITQPTGVVFHSDTIKLLTKILWPDSGDFEDIKAQPLVDIAEMVSDQAYPLGPPPSIEKTHKKFNEALPTSTFNAIKEVVDFSADTWLWTTLVLEPVIGAAVSLSASVEANDKAIEALKDRAKNNQWHQGKHLRLFGRSPNEAASCFDAPFSYPAPISFQEGGLRSGVHNFEYDKFEGNALFTYQLDELQAIQASGSGMQLSSFFNRLSTDMSSVLYNLLPLSFVYDWFSSEYSGALDLNNRLEMPISDWKLTLSYKLKCRILSEFTTELEQVKYAKYSSREYEACGVTREPRTIFQSYGFATELPDDYKRSSCSYWNKYEDWYRYVLIDNVKNKAVFRNTEHVTYYKRRVYTRPIKWTGELTTLPNHIRCFDTSKKDPLNDTGKQVTLGALIWGFLDIPLPAGYGTES